MKGTLFTIALVLAILNVSAQTITGRLVDNDGKSIAYANVALYVDTVLVKGTTTGDDGVFSLGCDTGTYNLVVSCVGYERISIRCRAGNLGTVTMNARQLKEVEITASHISEEFDRFVVLPGTEEVEAAGHTLVLLDMLKLPGLKVDVALETVTVDGGAAVLQINGKEVPLRRVSNLRADQIKRVEYINNPGVRYLDRGVAGIINIILKERDEGGHIDAYGQSALTTGFVNSGLSGSYYRGKSEFILGYFLNYRNYDDVPSRQDDSYLSPARTVTRSQTTNSPFRYSDNTLNAEYTYQHDDSTMFSISVRDNFLTRTQDAVGTMNETDNGTLSTQTMHRHSYQKDNMPSVDLFYTHKMAHGRKVELNVVGDYSVNRYDNTQSYTDGTYATTVDGHGYALSGEAVYSRRLAKVELRTGLQYQHNFSENEYTLYNTTSSMTKDNAYLYAEVVGAIGKKVSYSVGTGAKLLNVTDGTDEEHYIRNLSTARLRWRISDGWSVTANTSYIPTLPGLSSLSSVFQQTDDVEGQRGDPDLRPSEALSNNVTLRYDAPKGWYMVAMGGARHQFHPIVSTYDYNPALDLFIRTSHNADLFRNLFANAEVGVNRLWKCLNLSLNASYNSYYSKGSDFSHTRDNLSASFNGQFYWKGFALGAYFTLLPMWSLYGEDYSRREMAQTLYAQYRWNGFTAMIMWLCPFNSEGYRYEHVGLSTIHPYQRFNWTGDNGNMLVLSLRWQMDFGKKYRKSEKTLQNGGYENGIVR